MVQVVKNPPANAGDVRDTGLIPGWGRFPWRRKWQPTPVFMPGKSHGQRSYTVQKVAESDTTERLHFHFHALEKEMATHFSVLAWRIPGTVELGGLPSVGSHRVRYD